MTANFETSVVLDPDQILKEWTRRKQRYQARDDWYDRLSTYYFGSDAGDGIPILSMNSQGRPLLRPVGENPYAEKTYSSRRLPPIVDDFAALMGRMPASRVEPPDSSEQGEKKAELLTKYLYSTYELSGMDHQQALAGFYLSNLGDAVYLLEPDSEEVRVVWNVASPRYCLPSFKHGFRRFDLYDLMLYEVWSPDELARQLQVIPDSPGEASCTVVTYISGRQRTVLVGTKNPRVAADTKWDLDFCPAVWVRNKVTGSMGMSDIAGALDQQDFLDFCFAVWADGIVHMTYPVIGVKNPQSVSEDMVVGPGAPPVTLQGDGDIIVKNTQGDPRALMEIIGNVIEDINATSGTSGVRQEGKMKTSITTGRAVQSVQGPQSTRIEFKQRVLGEAIEKLNRMTLAMQETAPALKDFRGPIFGNYRGQSFREEFDASKDIDGWHRTKVTWQQLVGMNLQQKAAVAAEGMQFKLWDDLEARDLVGVEDPVGMRNRIETQMMSEAKLQQAMTATVEGQGQQGGQPGQGQPQEQGSQPAPFLFRPPRMGMAPTGAPPAPSPTAPSGGPDKGQEQPTGPTSQADFAGVLGKVVDKLRGSVFRSPTGTILISDHRDYDLVLQTVRSVDPAIRVRQMSEAKMPRGSVRLV